MSVVAATAKPVVWTERLIGRLIAQQVFNRKYLVVVPNCSWTGYECDILAVTESLRLIDVEIKISRADLKADARKDKWWSRLVVGQEPPETLYYPNGSVKCVSIKPIYENTLRPWPLKVWKHYYCLPAAIWCDDLFMALPSPNSGVLLMHDVSGGYPQIRCQRHAKPCRDADKIGVAAAIDIARLASLRMWDAFAALESVT